MPDIEAYKGLCEKAFARGQRPVRLLGLGVMFAEEPGPKPIAESQASFIVSDS
ncbi:MAG: hypothetical protein ACI9I4_001279 [Neolewinella sp.]